jgi:hypothetical protein
MPTMLNLQELPSARRTGRLSYRGRVVLSLSFCLMTTGCLSPLSKHAAAFSGATALVIDNSEDVYLLANNLHDEVVVSDAVVAFDANPAWDPHQSLKVLLTPEQIAARLTVLDGLKAYARTLVELTDGKPSESLEKAAGGVGGGMSGLASNAATAFGQGTGTTATLSPQVANGISTAVLALGEYLGARKVKSEAPRTIIAMDKTVSTICQFLEADLKTLTRQAKDDFEQEIEHENSFIRNNGTKLSPVEHRNEVASMLRMVRRERATEELYGKLSTAVERLALTHTALAAAAQKKDPESFKQNLADLVAAGTSLGHYYSSLSTQ